MPLSDSDLYQERLPFLRWGPAAKMPRLRLSDLRQSGAVGSFPSGTLLETIQVSCGLFSKSSWLFAKQERIMKLPAERGPVYQAFVMRRKSSSDWTDDRSGWGINWKIAKAIYPAQLKQMRDCFSPVCRSEFSANEWNLCLVWCAYASTQTLFCLWKIIRSQRQLDSLRGPAGL